MSTMTTPTRAPVFSVPNQLTALRFVLAIVLFGLITVDSWTWCLVVFIVAAFTDWLDGYVARLQNQTSSWAAISIRSSIRFSSAVHIFFC